MANKHAFDAVDTLLKYVTGKPEPFGGKVVVTLGDWRQIAPVDDSKSFHDPERSEFQDGFETSTFQLSIRNSASFYRFRQFHLRENIRCRTDPELHRLLLDIGEGRLSPIPLQEVLNFGVGMFTDVSTACSWLFEEDVEPYNPSAISQRAFITPYNGCADTVNDFCRERVEGFTGKKS
eukprot:PhF_6_TR18355/c0_g1_i1/m.27003